MSSSNTPSSPRSPTGHLSSTVVAQESSISSKIDKRLATAKEKSEGVIKLLLLGAGESGKSTLFKQFNNIYGAGFSTEDRKKYTPIVHGNVVSGMQILFRESETYGPCSAESQEFGKTLLEAKVGTLMNAEFGKQLVELWKDPAIKKTYENRSNFQFYDSFYYFFEKLDDLLAPNYIPSLQDILRSRVQTIGMTDVKYTIQGRHYHLLDVGGQRSQRKMWIKYFQDVSAVIFVAAISEYDQVIAEDGFTNRVVESLTMWEEISNSKWFIESAIILFLNKKDLLMDKLQKGIAINQHFDDYKGENKYENAVSFFKHKFAAKTKKKKEIYIHVTCATDTQNIKVIFGVVTDIVIRSCLKAAGLTV